MSPEPTAFRPRLTHASSPVQHQCFLFIWNNGPRAHSPVSSNGLIFQRIKIEHVSFEGNIDTMASPQIAIFIKVHHKAAFFPLSSSPYTQTAVPPFISIISVWLADQRVTISVLLFISHLIHS